MALEENKALIRRYIEELFNKHNLEVIYEIFSDDYVNHQKIGAGPDERIKSREEFMEVARLFFSAFPDQTTTVEDMIAEGDKVVTRWVTWGTNEGDFMGAPPTHKKVTIRGISIDRIADGKIAESWTNADMIDFMQQICAFPEKVTAAELFRRSEEFRREEAEASPH
jgi:steroid delta-isomerase-like uncharacterized protein